MRKRLIAIAAIVILALGAWFIFTQQAGASIGTIDLYTGTVTIKAGERERTGTSGDDVREDEIIVVPAGSRVGIVFKDGSLVRLDGPTTAIVHDLLTQKDQMIRGRVELIQGRVWSKIQGRVLADYAVETPTIVATVRGTCFNVSYIAAVSTVYVSCGTVGVRLKAPGSGTGILVGAGFMIQVRDDHAEEDLKDGPKPLPEADKNEWIHFNEDEDGEKESESSVSSSSASLSRSSAKSSEVSSKTTEQASSSRTVEKASSSAAKPVTGGVRLSLSVDKTSIDISELALFNAKATTDAGVATDETGNVSWEIHPLSIGSVDHKGQFHPAQAGDALISAHLGSVESNAVSVKVTVQTQAGGGTTGGQPPPQVVLSSVRVSCKKEATQAQTGPGKVVAQCAATAIMSDQTTQDVTKGADWSAKGTAQGFVDQNGYYVSGADRGTDTVTAAYGGKSGSATIDVP